MYNDIIRLFGFSNRKYSHTSRDTANYPIRALRWVRGTAVGGTGIPWQKGCMKQKQKAKAIDESWDEEMSSHSGNFTKCRKVVARF